MKRISKAQLAARDEAVQKIRAAYEELEDAIDDYNNTMRDLFTAVEEKKDALNAATQEALEVCGEVAGDIESYMADRSDKWQESENAERYQAWLDAWQNLELSEVEIEQPDPLSMEDLPDVDQLSDELEALPEEPE